jgi:hypothetical protein
MALMAPYLTLMSEDTPQRDYSLRAASSGLGSLGACIVWADAPCG